MTATRLATGYPEPLRTQLGERKLAALREVGADVLPGRDAGGVRVLDGTSPWLIFRADQLARASLGIEEWADPEDWAAAQVGAYPYRRSLLIEAGMLPEGWQP